MSGGEGKHRERGSDGKREATEEDDKDGCLRVLFPPNSTLAEADY